MKPLSRMISAIKSRFRSEYDEQDQLLKKQTEILHHGIEAKAELLDIQICNGHTGNLLTLKLWIRLYKTEGGSNYFHTLTLMHFNHIPHKGDLLHIKYLPVNTEVILVL